MRQRYPCMMLLVSLLSCQQQTDRAKAPPDLRPVTTASPASKTVGSLSAPFLIIPGRQVGPVSAATTEASLIALLGSENARRDTIYLAEGAFEIGTTLFRNTANQAQILWADKRRFARPESVLLRPARDEENNLLPGPAPQWITDKGLRLGMTLRAVEKLNGRAFALYGFGWDYGGLSASWRGGALNQKAGKTFVSLGFGVSESLSAAQEKLYESLLGDTEFGSDHPAMQKLNPTVQTLTISFQ